MLNRNILFGMLIAAGGCAKTSHETTESAETTPPAAEAQEAIKNVKVAEDSPGDKEAKVAARVKEFSAAEAIESKRWEDEGVEAQVERLIGQKFKSTGAALDAILKGPHRSKDSKARDEDRHPKETLEFFGVSPNSTVVELGAGAGWYTEILAPLLASSGKIYAVARNPAGPPDDMGTAYGKRYEMFFDRSPAAYGKIQSVYISPPDELKFGPDGSADVALAVREMHNWKRSGYLDAYLAHVHRVLKDKGTFGVVQHRAAEGSNADESAERGYLPQPWLVKTVEAAGFKLEDTSEVNANPKDTKNYEKGVWTLPPNYRSGDEDREKYKAIGESDRMTLKFKKVAKADKK